MSVKSSHDRTRISTRITPRTVEQINSIQSIKNILPKSEIEFFSSSQGRGLLYLSRFVSKVHTRAVHLRTNSRSASIDFDNDYDMRGPDSRLANNRRLSSQSRIIRRHYAMSLATLASKSYKRFEIVENGGIGVLIDFSLAADDDVISMSCAACFVFLSKEHALRNKLIQDNCLNAILVLLQNNNVEIKKDCFRALCNLAMVDGFERKITKEGIASIIPSLVRKNQDILEVCLKLLLNLSCVNEKYTRLEEVTQAIVELYNAFHRFEEKELLIMQAACNLSSLRSNHYHLVEEGMLSVIDKAAKSSVKRCIVIASECLKNLSTCPRTRGKLIDNNIMKVFVTILSNEVVEVRVNCLNAFVNFVLDPACALKVANTAVLTAIVGLCLSTNSPELGRSLARVLKVLSVYPYVVPKLLNTGVIRAIEHLVTSATKAAHTLHFCAESLRYLYECSDQHAEFLRAKGALNLLVLITDTCSSPVTKESCAFTLRYIVERNIPSTDELRDLVLPCLISLYSKDAANANFLVAATIALITHHKAVDASSTVPVLVQMLTRESIEGTKRNAAASLCNLSYDYKNCETMLEVGALIPVVQLTQSDDLITKMTCASILSTLSRHSDFSAQFRHAAVLSVLLKLSRVDHIPTQRRIVIALSNLSQNPELRAILIEQQPIQYINSLASKPDENIRRGCAAIICNLSYDPGSEAAFTKADIVSCLLIIALVASDQHESKATCVKALSNLMADSTLLPSMVKDNIVWGISSLAVADSEELLTLCANALVYIAYYQPREILTNSAVERVVTKLITHNDTVFNLMGISLLYIVFPYLDNSNELDEKLCISFILNSAHIAASIDPTIYGMFITCLSRTSQLVCCREQILKANLFSNINIDIISQDTAVCDSFLALLTNITLSCDDISEVLIDSTFQLLNTISKMNDEALSKAILQLLYCISCNSNSMSHFKHPFCFSIFETSLQTCKTAEINVINLASSFLYNVTTVALHHHFFVSVGIVKMFLLIWEDVQQDAEKFELAILGICHLACGQVNTSRMIEDGCGLILASAVNPSGMLQKSTYERLAAAWRNLFCNMAHQEQLVDVGGLDAVICLAHRAVTEGYPLSMIHNCTTTLRTITFNPELRDLIGQTAAVDIILSDLGEGIIPNSATKKNLLRFLETESWSNGSRGVEKDGRAAPIACKPLHNKYLSSVEVVMRKYKIPLVSLEKFLVHVNLDSVAEESESELKRETHKFVIESKSSFDADDSNFLRTMSCPKQGCDESDNPLYFLSHDAANVDEILRSSSAENRKMHGRIDNAASSDSTHPLSPVYRRPGDSSSIGIRGGDLDDNSTTPAQGENKRMQSRETSRQTKRLDELVATIKKSKKPNSKISVDDILHKFALTKKFT